jgi:hypothetical protein
MFGGNKCRDACDVRGEGPLVRRRALRLNNREASRSPVGIAEGSGGPAAPMKLLSGWAVFDLPTELADAVSHDCICVDRGTGSGRGR